MARCWYQILVIQHLDRGDVHHISFDADTSAPPFVFRQAMDSFRMQVTRHNVLHLGCLLNGLHCPSPAPLSSVRVLGQEFDQGCR